MGRIEEALRQAKKSHGRVQGSSTSNLGGAAISDRAPGGGSIGNNRVTPRNVFAALSQKAGSLQLDPDVLRENRVTTDAQHLHVRAAYKMLRTRILSRLRSNRWNSLAVSSARSNAGKTLTAINTSISIAHELSQHVILVDLDLRRPSIADYFGIQPAHDLVDHLVQGTPIDQVVVRTDIERLLVIPALNAQENSSELLSGPAMQSLASYLASDADGAIVVYDLPPMLEADDMLAFAPNVDSLLFVVAECETKRADLQRVENLIEEINVLGVVLNKSNDSAPTYY